MLYLIINCQYTMYKILFLFIFSLIITNSLGQDLPPQTPIIGIYTQTYKNTSTSKSSYIAASYVKFIQMSGAQVVPIYSFAPTDQVLGLMRKINGVLFTGGDMDYDINSLWTKNADAILRYAIQQNAKGNPFPIFGTCMGIQLLAYLTSEYDSNIITRVYGDSAIVLPINLVNKAYLFQTFNSIQKDKLTKGHGLMYFNHNWAVTMQTFNYNPYLKNIWTLTATATTPFNQKFVAAWEAKEYPFYGVQFHPQKNMFEWKIYADRSTQGAQVVQIMSNRFVQVARRNKNRFNSVQQFVKASIYNFKTEPTQFSFTQIYVFDQVPRHSYQDQNIGKIQ